MGEPYYDWLSSFYCEEIYMYDEPSKKWDTNITCDEPKMSLEPNGRYEYARINPLIHDLNPDYKDSISVEVGKCAMITP